MPISIDPAPVRQPLLDSNDKSGRLSSIWQKWFSQIQNNLGLGLIASNNLSDVKDVPTSRSNLGLTDAAIMALPVALTNGGTGATDATDATDARTNLGLGSASTHAAGDFAGSGVNSDIIELTGLTTPLSVFQGGTGSQTAANARTALGVPGLSAPNTFSGSNAFNAAVTGSFGGWQTWTPTITPASGMTVSGFL